VSGYEATAVYGANAPIANVSSCMLGTLYEAPIVGMGRNGVVPFTVGNTYVRTVPLASGTLVWRVKLLDQSSHDASRRKLVPASARPAGLYQMALMSSAPATNAPPRPRGRTPRSVK
jgi:hypothetical protein